MAGMDELPADVDDGKLFAIIDDDGKSSIIDDRDGKLSSSEVLKAIDEVSSSWNIELNLATCVATSIEEWSLEEY